MSCAISILRPGVSRFVALLLLFGLNCRVQGADTPPSDASSGIAKTRASFPALHQPATGEQHPGKIVWADLFTDEPAAATRFYRELFHWSVETTTHQGRTYAIFSNHGRPVAGLTPRSGKYAKRPSRWLNYIAVDDLKATLALVATAGGKVRAPARDFPDRGIEAIISDNDDSPVGLLQSSSGDALDDEPDQGEWNWFELYANEPKLTASFYSRVFNYVAAPDDRTERKNDFLLSTEDIPRAGVAPRPERAEASAGWLGVVRVPNIAATVTRARELGGEILVPPRDVAYGSQFAIIADPTGGTIGLVEYVDDENPATHR